MTERLTALGTSVRLVGSDFVNVVIVGMRGAGKTNVSRRLSLITKRPAMSTDELAVYEAGVGIPDFVAARGWPQFRDLEYQVLGKLSRCDDCVVDCGGGIMVDLDQDGTEILSDRKVALLKEMGPIVWLHGDLARLAYKAGKSAERPVLDHNRSAMELMERRLPWYEEIADVTIEIEGKSRQAITERIVREVVNETS